MLISVMVCHNSNVTIVLLFVPTSRIPLLFFINKYITIVILIYDGIYTVPLSVYYILFYFILISVFVEVVQFCN